MQLLYLIHPRVFYGLLVSLFLCISFPPELAQTSFISVKLNLYLVCTTAPWDVFEVEEPSHPHVSTHISKTRIGCAACQLNLKRLILESVYYMTRMRVDVLFLATCTGKKNLVINLKIPFDYSPKFRQIVVFAF